MKSRRAIILAAAALLVAPVARSGHEQPVYPSYYPHEIEIAALAPQRRPICCAPASCMPMSAAPPAFARRAADSIGSVESLGSFVVVRLNPNSPLAKDEASACAAAGPSCATWRRERAAAGSSSIPIR